VKWKLLVFGGGSPRYEAAARRVSREAVIPEIDAVVVESPSTLARDHADFWGNHGGFIESNPRLYGYAIWKPELLDAHLRDLPTGWGLVYVDAGCVINHGQAARTRMSEYLSAAEATGLWATQLDRPRWSVESFKEEAWTKADLLDATGASTTIKQSAQWQSGMIVLTPRASVLSLMQDWRTLSVEAEYRYSNDAPSLRPESPAFIEHRHDQSIFSVLGKVHGFSAVSDETWFGPDWFLSGRKYPFWAARWRVGSAMRPWNPRYVRRLARTAVGLK
jgi:hypothetical protein